MPIRRFWLLEKNVSRLEAASDLRRLDVATAVLSAENHRQLGEKLARELGSVVVEEAKLDKRGLESLKGLAQLG